MDRRIGAQLYTVRDFMKTIEELVSSFDKSKPIILIDHEPYELEEIAKAGVDLDLSGHTHNGQMFPSNVFIKFIWKNRLVIRKMIYINN